MGLFWWGPTEGALNGAHHGGPPFPPARGTSSPARFGGATSSAVPCGCRHHFTPVENACSCSALEPGRALCGREPIFWLPHTNPQPKRNLGGVQPPPAGGPTPTPPRDCEGEAPAPPGHSKQWARWRLRLAKQSRQQWASGVAAVECRCEPRASSPLVSGARFGFRIMQATSWWSPVQLVGAASSEAPRNGGFHWVVSPLPSALAGA